MTWNPWRHSCERRMNGWKFWITIVCARQVWQCTTPVAKKVRRYKPSSTRRWDSIWRVSRVELSPIWVNGLHKSCDWGLSNTRTWTLEGFIYSHRSFPALAPLTAALNTPVTDVSQWQSSSPMTAVANLLSSLKWSSVAVVSQSKKLLSSFYRSASNSHVCIVTQTVLSSNIKCALAVLFPVYS